MSAQSGSTLIEVPGLVPAVEKLQELGKFCGVFALWY